VTGVPHEFTTIPGAVEDMTLLLLNLKQVRMACHTDEPVRLRLVAKGKSVVMAGDIECPPEVEVVNPELRVLTLDTLDSELEIEMIAERGRGYSPAEERADLPIGEIPVDAVFSPIVKVANTVEAARIEQITDYDMLKLEIWTDGTIAPGDALCQAARVLVSHLLPVAEFVESDVELAEEESEEQALPEFYAAPIEELELSMRSLNCLKRAGITAVGEVMERLEKGAAEMLAIRNFGQKSLEELVGRLKAKGYLEPSADFDV
jgi:DNA-directed RNA polymerase subunit alpha